MTLGASRIFVAAASPPPGAPSTMGTSSLPVRWERQEELVWPARPASNVEEAAPARFELHAAKSEKPRLTLLLAAGQTCRLLRKTSARTHSSDVEMETPTSAPP